MSSRGEKYHRRLHPVAPDPTTDLETIQFGHVDVEDDEVGAFALTARRASNPLLSVVTW